LQAASVAVAFWYSSGGAECLSLWNGWICKPTEPTKCLEAKEDKTF